MSLDEEGWFEAAKVVPEVTGRIKIRTLYEVEGDYVVGEDGSKSFTMDNSTAVNMGILSWIPVRGKDEGQN